MIFPLWLIFIVFPSIANTTIETKIHDIDWAKTPHERTLLLLETGQVIKVGRDFSISKKFKSFHWKFTIDHKHNLKSMGPLSSPEKLVSHTFLPEEYRPTVVNSSSRAKKYFRHSRISRGETQCFNRAHVWAYELWKKYGVKSQKIFVFYSRKYIRRHNFGWWFHVAPLLRVDGWDETEDLVIDPRYITAPRSVDWWLGKFMSGSFECKEISKYSDYADYPYSEDCFVYKAPMYIYQPLDLEMLEVWGVTKPEFILQDLQWAYKEAFQIDFQGEAL